MKADNQWYKRVLDRGIVNVIRYTLVFGLLAHGVMLFNKYSWHDDLAHMTHVNVDSAVALGRWMRAWLAFVVSKYFGGTNLSLPLLHGAASLLLIAISAFIIIQLFDVRERLFQILICGIMVTFPVVAGIFGYMFTASYYFLALLFATASAYIVIEQTGILSFLLAAVLVSFTMGTYQAFFTVTVSLLMIRLIFDVVYDNQLTLKGIVRRGIYYYGMCVVGIVLYFVVWKVCMKALGLTATSYKGLDSIGKSGIEGYWQGIVSAYRAYFQRFNSRNQNMYPQSLSIVQWVVIGLSIISSIVIVIRKFRKNKINAVVLVLMIVLLPLCFNLIYLLCAASSGDANIHSLMVYGQTMQYVYLLCAIRYLRKRIGNIGAICCKITIAVLLIMISMNIRFDNACYLYAEVKQQQVIASVSALVAEIKSTEGYTDTTPVCIVSVSDKDKSFKNIDNMGFIQITPYGKIYPTTVRNLTNIMKYWCGFSPKYVSGKKIRKLDQYKQMPHYPNDGSVQLIDDTIVVKW